MTISDYAAAIATATGETSPPARNLVDYAAIYGRREPTAARDYEIALAPLNIAGGAARLAEP